MIKKLLCLFGIHKWVSKIDPLDDTRECLRCKRKEFHRIEHGYMTWVKK